MLHGRSPFKGNSVIEVYENVKKGGNCIKWDTNISYNAKICISSILKNNPNERPTINDILKSDFVRDWLGFQGDNENKYVNNIPSNPISSNR